MNKKNILIICPFVRPNIGGVESHITKLINYTTSKGFYVTVLTYQPLTVKTKGESLEKHENYEIHRVNWFGNGWFNKLENYFPLAFAYLFPGLFVKSLFYFLKNYRNIQAIHAHGLAAATITAILKKIHPIKTVVSTHAVYNFEERPLLKNIIKFVLYNFDVILAVSEISRQEIIKMGFKESKVKVHPNWIETDKFILIDRNIAKNELKITSKHNFLFVGRLIEKKGVLTFLDLAKHFSQEQFHIVGEGPLTDKVIEATKTMTNVSYHGILRQDNPDQFTKIVNLYNACNAHISPYQYDEGFSTTLIESLSCGTPNIVPLRGSPPTFLPKHETYFLSYNPAIQETSEVVSKIINGIELKDRQKCRDYAIKHFSSSNADVIIESYE